MDPEIEEGKGAQSGDFCTRNVWLDVCIVNSIVGGSGAMLPQKNMKFRCLSTLLRQSETTITEYSRL